MTPKVGLLKTLLYIIALGLPLLVFIVPLPIADSYYHGWRLGVLAFVLYTIIGAGIFGSFLARNLSSETLLRSFATTSLVLLLLVVLLSLFFDWELPFALGFVLLWFGIFLFSLVDNSRIRIRGLMTFLIALAILCSFELTLSAIPERYLIDQVVVVPPLAERERSEALYEQKGFRGERPCTDCSEQAIRIFTMGGSSTYGIPLYYSTGTYSSVLGRMLEERRVGESFEVFNAGIAGHGIIQVLHSIEASIIEHKPDIISIMSWFNDSAPGPGWWGVHGKSDRDAYIQLRVLWTLQNWWLYQQIHSTRAYGLFRFYVLRSWEHLAPLLSSGKEEGKGHPTRISPKEFRWALEEVMKLGKEHDFLPVLILEPLHRTHPVEKMLEKNRYYQVIFDVSKKYNVPLVDTVTPMSKRQDQWLFYDFIHPNLDGHRLIAEELYDTLLTKSKVARDFLHSRGVNLDLPELKRHYHYQFESDKLAHSTLEFNIRAPYLAEFSTLLNFYVNGEIIGEPKTLSSKFQQFKLAIPEQALKTPIVDIAFEAGAVQTAGMEPYKLRDTDRYSPVHLEVKSGGKDYGWTVQVEANGKRLDPKTRGYNVVVLGGDSGKYLSSAAFDTFSSPEQSIKLIEYLESLSSFTENGEPPIVIIAVHTDGFHNVDSELLSQAVEKLGGSGKLPGPFESYALIGVPGAAPGTAIEELGPRLVELSVGSEEITRAKLLEVQEINF